MKTNLLKSIAVLALVFSMTSCSSPEEASIESVEVINVYEYNETEARVLNLINQYRASLGLNTLERINHISYKSSQHSEYMVATNDVGHANFGERQNNMHQALGALKVGENVAFNYSSPEAVVQAWLNSAGHKASIEGDYTHFGISVRQNDLGQKYYTNMFIKK